MYLLVNGDQLVNLDNYGGLNVMEWKPEPYGIFLVRDDRRLSHPLLTFDTKEKAEKALKNIAQQQIRYLDLSLIETGGPDPKKE